MSRVLSFWMAFAMLLVIVPGSVFGGVARLLMLAGALYVIVRTFSRGCNFRRLEWRWLVLFLLYLVASVLSAAFSPKPELGLTDAGRQFFIMLVTLGMLILFRDERAVGYYRNFLVLPCLLGALTIIGGFFVIVGVPTFDNVSNLAAFKYDMNSRFGVNPNPLSFAVLLTFVLTWRTKDEGRPPWFWIYAAVVALSILLSGARTSLVIVAGTVLTVFVFRRPIKGFMLIPAGLLIAAVVASSAVFTQGVVGMDLLLSLSEFTTGRTELWNVAIDKFVERPVLGWGALTWDLDLWRYLSSYTSDLTRWDELGSGAFHNAYLTHLAEKGLIGLGIQLALTLLLTRAAFRLYWLKDHLDGLDRSVASMAPYAVTLILLRGLSENGGLLGYANAGVDFISYAAVAMILSTYVRSA